MRFRHLALVMSNALKDLYIDLCSSEPSIPFFCQAWWLDAVAQDSWGAVVLEKNGNIVAALPYFIDGVAGVTAFTQPPLTQHLGPWIKKQECKYSKRLAREKDFLQALYGLLPDYGYYSQKWNVQYDNWLPLFWKGFKQTTRYTYRLSLRDGVDSIWSGLQENIRREIKKAKNREALSVREDNDLEAFYVLNKMVFERQGKKLPYSLELLKRIDEAAGKRGCRKIFIASDAEGRDHAGLYLVWDHDTAYYLMGGANPDLRSSGATSLCMWEAICFASSVVENFDFEGSMIEPVERYFRSFGAIQTPFHHITHVRSPIVGLMLTARDIVDSVKGKGNQ